jgi:hypothetical protein
MASAPVVAARSDTHCPLCGKRILSLGQSGWVMTEDPLLIPLHRGRSGEGFMLCEECGMLAALPADMTLN